MGNISQINGLQLTAATASFIGPTLNQNVTINGTLNVTTLSAVTSSIQYITSSQFNVSTNVIKVNTTTPLRYGGIEVVDSGSSPMVSGSLLFDSQNNQWVFIHQNVSGAITSSVLIMGPQTFNNVGNETTIGANRITKGSGGDLGEHITSSNITDTGTVVSINSNSEITGSLCITSNIIATSFTGSFSGDGSGITNLPSTGATLGQIIAATQIKYQP